MPLYAVAFMMFTMANVGLPGTSGFIGEFLTLIGGFQANSWVALLRDDRRDPVGRLCALSLSARHLRRDRESRRSWACSDLDRREIAMLLPLGLLTIYYGVHPQPIIDASAASIEQLIKGFQQALAATKTAGL